MKTFKKNPVPFMITQYMVILLLVSSCELLEKENPLIIKDPKNLQITYYGPAVPLGKGKAQSFITLNKGGDPTAMGVAMSENALENLPTAHEGEEDHSFFEYILQLPKQARITAFKFITLDWNPLGHEPEGIYNLPHFDFHFYLISNNERLAITPLAPDEMDPDIPLAKYLPEMYVQTPGRAPQMGVHWLDPNSPELHGSKFDRTFIYGTSNKKVAFMEPMITLEYIKSKPSNVDPIHLPKAFQESGFYPSKYEVKYEASRKEYLILFSGFSLKMAEN